MIEESVFQAAKLCVVGNINRDIVTAPISSSEAVLRDGETSVAWIRERVGGGGAISAAAAAHLGADVTLLTQIGNDRLGANLEKAMTQHGVQCMFFYDEPGTGTTLNIVHKDGERHFISCHPNNEAITFENLRTSEVPAGGHLFRCDIWFSEAMIYGGNEKLFRWAREEGFSTSIDLNWDPRWNTASPEEIQLRKEAIRQILPLVDLGHGNINELNHFADVDDDIETALSKLTQWGLGAVVLHMGTRGSGYFENGRLTRAPAAQVQRQSTSTGTGDLLSTAMALLHHRDDISVPDKLCLANRIVGEYLEGKRDFVPSISVTN